MGQSVETWVDDQWRKQAFTTFPENMEYSSSLVLPDGRSFAVLQLNDWFSYPLQYYWVMLIRLNLCYWWWVKSMAATSTTNSTQFCPKSKMTEQIGSQMCRQSFVWIESLSAFKLKKNNKKNNHPPLPRIACLEQRVLWKYCMFRPEISVATPPPQEQSWKNCKQFGWETVTTCKTLCDIIPGSTHQLMKSF